MGLLDISTVKNIKKNILILVICFSHLSHNQDFSVKVNNIERKM